MIYVYVDSVLISSGIEERFRNALVIKAFLLLQDKYSDYSIKRCNNWSFLEKLHGFGFIRTSEDDSIDIDTMRKMHNDYCDILQELEEQL